MSAERALACHYRPRNPRATPLYRLVEAHYDEVKGLWEDRSLFVGPFIEMNVAPDGSAVTFCYGRGQMAMGLAVLKLEPPSEPDGLPGEVGEPLCLASTNGTWHVHNGGWSADSKRLVYTRDMDYGETFELVEGR